MADTAPIITVIGAASTTFGPKLLRDVIHFAGFEGATLRLVDVDTRRLDIYTRLARRLTAAVGRSVTVQATTDRDEALPGSRYVVISVEQDHYPAWRTDCQIPNQLGARQVQGELGGPGGLFHSLRQIPLHMDFARDIARHCPHAMVLVCSNPLNRLCLAMHRHAGLDNVVGLCHGAEMAIYLLLQHHMNVAGDDMEITAAGTNHLTWLLQLRHKQTGEDLVPAMRNALDALPPETAPLSRKMLDIFGHLPATLDSHAGEYLPFAHELAGLEGPNFDRNLSAEHERWDLYEQLLSGAIDWDAFDPARDGQSQTARQLGLSDLLRPREWADTLVGPIVQAIETHQRARMPALNLLNQGTIDNLPGDVFVEGPGYVDASGIQPVRVGPLPAPLAEFNRRDCTQAELTVQAALSRSKADVLQAMLTDPTIDSVHNTERIMHALFQAHHHALGDYH